MTKQAQRYARLMGSFWRHPRTALLSPSAIGIHVRAISFCADNMTDGAIPLPMVAAFCGGVLLEVAVAEVVEAGLWKKTKLGYEIRDWAQHNITSAGWAKQKADVAARVAKSRSKRAGNAPGSADVTRYTKPGNDPSSASDTPASLDEGRRTKDEHLLASLGGDPAPAAPSPGPSEAERIEELSKPYPAELLRAVEDACRRHRRTGRMQRSVWLATLDRLAAFAPDVAIRAMQVFIDRHSDGSKGEDYLLGIARGERDRPVSAPHQQRLNGIARMPAPARNEDFPDGMDSFDMGATG